MATPAPIRLTLASGSPARRELLTRAGLAFDVRPAHIDEPTGEGFHDARHYVHTVAWLKAAAVAPTVSEAVVRLHADRVDTEPVAVHRTPAGPDAPPGDPAYDADARAVLRHLDVAR